ncbi:MAG: hypothetical protein ACTSRP_06880 [Candidatus Helarchaeota archaeon]
MIPDDPEKNIEKLLEYASNLERNKVSDIWVFLDADRTLCEIDTSRLINEYCKIPLEPIKEKFRECGYVYESFYHMNQCYSAIPLEKYLYISKKIAKSLKLYDGVKKFFTDLKNIVNLCIITSGIKKIWEYTIKLNNLKSVHLIAGTRIDDDDFLVGRYEKGVIIDFFKNNGNFIICIGDSDIDTLMLQKANLACIVVNHKYNKDLIDHIRDHPNIYQISYNNYLHSSIRKITYIKLINIILNLKKSKNKKIHNVG